MGRAGDVCPRTACPQRDTLSEKLVEMPAVALRAGTSNSFMVVSATYTSQAQEDLAYWRRTDVQSIFHIDDPGKLPVLGIVNLIENIAAFFA